MGDRRASADSTLHLGPQVQQAQARRVLHAARDMGELEELH